MSIDHWALEDVQNMQIVRYIYFVCSTVCFSSSELLGHSSTQFSGVDLGCYHLLFRWCGSVHQSPYDMGRYHLCVIQVITSSFVWSSDQQCIFRVFTGLTMYALLPFMGKWLNSPREEFGVTLQLALVTRCADCKVIIYTAGWIGVAATCSSTYLFLCRVNSVFYESSRAKFCFSCMWLFGVMSVLVLPSQYTAAVPKPPHALCVIKSVKRFAFLLLMPVALFDWVVFWAISIRVITIFVPHNHWRGVCKAFTTCADIGVLPRALLRTGQFYFL